MTRPILNLDELVFDTQTHGERFEARMAPVASRIGAAKLGYRVTQVPPGKRAWPFHSHHANEDVKGNRIFPRVVIQISPPGCG